MRLPRNDLDWDEQIRFCESMSDCAESARERATHALRVLRRLLGENFLKEGNDNRHPLPFGLIRNYAPWTRLVLAWLGEAIVEFESAAGFDSVRQRLLAPRRYDEVVSVLQLAWKVRRAGFGVEFDPEFEVGGKAKQPDLVISHPALPKPITVEVSRLLASRSSRLVYRTTDAVMNAISGFPLLVFSCRIERALASRHLAEVAARVHAVVRTVRGEDVLRTLEIPHVLEMCVAPECAAAEVSEWASARGLSISEISGPPLRSDEIARARVKVGREQRQLPRDGPGIVYVVAPQLFWYIKEPGETARRVLDEVYEHPHVAAAVLAGEWVARPTEARELSDDFTYVCGPRSDEHMEHHLVLPNRFADHPLGDVGTRLLLKAIETRE